MIENLFELTDTEGKIIEGIYHAKDLKHVEEKFTISTKEPLTTEEKPTVRTQELTSQAHPVNNTQVRKPGRPRKTKRGKVRKTALAPKQPGNQEGSDNATNNINQNKDEYKSFHTYQTRSKTTNQINKKPEDKRKVADKRPEDQVEPATKRPRGRPCKHQMGVGGKPRTTSFVNSAYIGSEFIARVFKKCDQNRSI